MTEQDSGRMQRIGEQIARQLAMTIQQGLKDPRVKLVSISSVTVTRDLGQARVSITAFGTAEEARVQVAVLNRAKDFLRCVLAKKLSLRVTPRLTFVYDEKSIQAQNVLSLINKSMHRDAPHQEDEIE